MTTDKLLKFRTCMSKSLSDLKGVTPLERRIHFAISSKICSQKESDLDRAYAYVQVDHPEWFTDNFEEYRKIFKRFGVIKEQGEPY